MLNQAQTIQAAAVKAAFVLDVRSESEYAKGCIPGSVNIPILSDDERRQVGICYKQEGQQAAVELGHRLVEPFKAQRIRKWIEAVEQNDSAAVMCWRGGMRSEIAQTWIAEQGLNLPRVAGGYKAARGYLMLEIGRLSSSLELVVLAGQTGSGKTDFLDSHAGDFGVIDLEFRAKHRGSAFGGVLDEQPAQATFENFVAYDLIETESSRLRPVLVENESLLIGRLVLPRPLYARMQLAKTIVLEAPLEERVRRIASDYVISLIADLGSISATRGCLLECLAHIKKRLGGMRFDEAQELLEQGFERYQATQETSEHFGWIEYLLLNYYDPMYDFGIKKRENQVVFRGDSAQVQQYLSNLSL